MPRRLEYLVVCEDALAPHVIAMVAQEAHVRGVVTRELFDVIDVEALPVTRAPLHRLPLCMKAPDEVLWYAAASACLLVGSEALREPRGFVRCDTADQEALVEHVLLVCALLVLPLSVQRPAMIALFQWLGGERAGTATRAEARRYPGFPARGRGHLC